MPKLTQQKRFAARAVASLQILDLTTTLLAREFGCHRNSVIRAIYQAKCPHIHQRVCQRLNLKPII